MTDTRPEGLEDEGLRIAEVDGRYEVRAHVAATRLGEVTGILHAAGIHTFTATPPSLDDLFLDAYSGTGTHSGPGTNPGTGNDAGTAG